MREIKFRVWTGKRFVYWGFVDGVFLGSPHFSDSSILKIQKLSQQFTGLRDINGKEIYEGDVVRALGSLIETPYVVKLGFYENKICSCHRKYNSYGWYIESAFTNNCYELGDYTHIPETGLQILGNIYEYKELLNGTNERN